MRPSRETATALRRALASSRRAFWFVALFSFVINLLMLTLPIYMLQVYDRVLTARSVDTLLMLTILAISMLLLLGLLEMARSRVLVRIGARLDDGVNAALFDSLLESRLQSSPSASHPVRDLDQLRMFLTGSALIALFDSPWTPLFIALIFVFHPLLGTIALIGAILLFSLAILSELLTRKPLEAAGKEAAQAQKLIDSAGRNAEAIAAMGMADTIRERWLDRHISGLVHQAHASDRAGVLSATAKVMRLILQVTMLGSGAYLAIQQIITPGVMIAASIILGRALAPVEAAIGGWRHLVAARSAYGRLRKLLGELGAPATKLSLPTPNGKLEVHVSAAGPPTVQKPVLRKVGFRLEPGEALGVIGPSAAGKSTLARLLVGLWKPRSGHVRLDGADVADWDHRELGQHVGYLPQDTELLDGTVADNIRRFREGEAQAVVEAASRAGVHDLILQLPDGYDTRVGEGGGALSGGQRQRIGLARALFGEPALVVLDEPNSNLDSEGEEALRAALVWLKEAGKTVVVISHRPNVLSVMDKIVVLRKGKMEDFGPSKEIIAKLTRPVASSGKTAVTGPRAS